ncbi:DUF4288 domain-containing protein [Actinomadura sp. NPDC049753]|uniref:DUF4288 domain-containing protein n=1 Tax=Actinomadura sp. NPDC049753 TaxID=3154739 RepID=UPI0034365DB9
MDEQEEQQLYIAALVFSVVVEGGYRPARYSEDVVLINAGSEDEARLAAERAGEREQTSYLNQFGDTVRWTFLGVADLQMSDLPAAEPGVSLYSRSFDDLDHYRRLFNIPTDQLQRPDPQDPPRDSTLGGGDNG